MENFRLEEGDLELLALGRLDQEKELYIYELLDSDSKLKKEFEAIQEVLEKLSFENGIDIPEKFDFEKLYMKVNKKPNGITRFLRMSYFKYAAIFIGILFLGYLYNSGIQTGKKDILAESKVAVPDIAEGNSIKNPIGNSEIEKLFDFLNVELREKSCKGNFKRTEYFLSQNKLDITEFEKYLSLKKVHCDCQVLLNLSNRFPRNNYPHGTRITDVISLLKQFNNYTPLYIYSCI